MSKRFWFYLLVIILFAGLLAMWDWQKNRVEAQSAAQTSSQLAASRQELTTFLARQTDGPKLIGLAKRLNKNQPELIQPVVEKAYALAPTNPDAVLLNSAYHPELKVKALQLNPLIDQTINPAAPLGQLR